MNFLIIILSLISDVPILHLIPTPFPDVWHKPSDDRSAVDMDTVENINKVLRVFVSEYLGLNLWLEGDGEDDSTKDEFWLDPPMYFST